MSENVVAPAEPPQRSLVDVLERALHDSTVDITKLERLLALMEHRERHAAEMAFNGALAEAKGQFKPIVKRREVDYTTQKGRTSYRYEDFAAVAEIVDPVLRDHGLSYRFRSSQPAPGKLRVACILSHRDGHSEETSLEAMEDTSGQKNPVQSIGSSATYLQRYTLKLALGLAAAADDDAQAPKAAADDPAIDADQLAYLRQLMGEAGHTDERIDKWVRDRSPIRVSKYKEALVHLQAGIAEKKKAEKK